MEQLLALEEFVGRDLRDRRAAVPSRPGVLRVLPPVAPLPPGVAVLDPGRGHDPGRDRPCPVGWDPSAGADVRRQGETGRSRTSLGVARANNTNQGVGLLARSVRPPHLTAGRRRGSVLYRREGAT